MSVCSARLTVSIPWEQTLKVKAAGPEMQAGQRAGGVWEGFAPKGVDAAPPLPLPPAPLVLLQTQAVLQMQVISCVCPELKCFRQRHGNTCSSRRFSLYQVPAFVCVVPSAGLRVPISVSTPTGSCLTRLDVLSNTHCPRQLACASVPATPRWVDL